MVTYTKSHYQTYLSFHFFMNHNFLMRYFFLNFFFRKFMENFCNDFEEKSFNQNLYLEKNH